MRIEKGHLRIAGLVAVIGMLILIGSAVEPARLLSPERLRELAADHPLEAAGVFFVAAAGVKLLFVPFAPISFAGGLVFGGAMGGSLALLALFTSSSVSFGLGRGLGRGWVADLVEENDGKLRTVERLLRRHGLLTVVVLRIVPTLPLSAVNLIFGHTSVRVRDFALGTILGMAPGCYLLAFVGDEALEPLEPRFWLFASFLALLTIAGLLLGRRLKREVDE